MLSCPVCKLPYPKRVSSNISYTYYFCLFCKTLFLSPLPSKSFLQNYYKKVFKYSLAVHEPCRETEKKNKILTKLISLNKGGKTFLDIGSGNGSMLRLAEKQGLIVTGIEPSKNLFRTSYQPKYGTLFNSTFEAFADIHRNKYDFICLQHVIEHIVQPRKMLVSISKLLSPKGVLYIETPNVDSTLYYSELEHYTFMTPPDHVIIYSKRSLLSIVPHSLSLVVSQTYSYPEHFSGVVKRKFNAIQVTNRVSNQPSVKQSKPTRPSYLKRLKYFLFDKCFSEIFYPLLNLGDKGSILSVYLRR